MEWYLGPLRKYADFTGRATRKEYWLFFLGQSVIGLVLSFTVPVLYAVFLLGTIVPMLAVWVRRLHDTNRSGRWCFIVLVPLVGNIAMLVFLATEGTSGDNDYGPAPSVLAAGSPPNAGSSISARPPSSSNQSSAPESSSRDSEPSASPPPEVSRPVIKMRGPGEDKPST